MNLSKTQKTNWIFVLILLGAFGIQLTLGIFFVSSWFNLGLSLAVIGFSLIRLQARIALLIFTLALDLFLIIRPVIDIITGFSQYLSMHYLFASAERANAMIAVSLIAITAGHLIYEDWLEEKEKKATVPFPSVKDKGRFEGLGIAVGMISFFALFLTIQEKIRFRLENSYTALYSAFESDLPFVVVGFSAIAVTMVILIVVSSRRRAVVYGALFIYLVLQALYMRTGVRADFTKAFLFSLFILFQKDLLKRLSRKYTAVILAGAVTLLAVLGGVFYTVEKQRLDYEKTHQHPVLLQLSYDQSISYMTLNRGQELKDLPLYEDKQYTFGPFLDQFGAARALKPYTMEFVEGGDSLAADIAYHLYGDNAFQGYGLGSSYIMELYHDFGYAGILIGSLLLGILLGSLSRISWTNILVDAVKLRMLVEVFYIPRAPATQFLVNLLVPQFYLPVIGSLIFACGLSWIGNRRRTS